MHCPRLLLLPPTERRRACKLRPMPLRPDSRWVQQRRRRPEPRFSRLLRSCVSQPLASAAPAPLARPQFAGCSHSRCMHMAAHPVPPYARACTTATHSLRACTAGSRSSGTQRRGSTGSSRGARATWSAERAHPSNTPPRSSCRAGPSICGWNSRRGNGSTGFGASMRWRRKWNCFARSTPISAPMAAHLFRRLMRGHSCTACPTGRQ
mmetsp:Transcript_36969/g.86345  ORF Transcript_36969/g.86345 Transcript_36969/m.86345 type:complete len:208 (+) Transcript_36969:180-803(+)